MSACVNLRLACGWMGVGLEASYSGINPHRALHACNNSCGSSRNPRGMVRERDHSGLSEDLERAEGSYRLCGGRSPSSSSTFSPRASAFRRSRSCQRSCGLLTLAPNLARPTMAHLSTYAWPLGEYLAALAHAHIGSQSEIAARDSRTRKSSVALSSKSSKRVSKSLTSRI